MKNLKKLFYDPKRFFYEVGYNLTPPYLEEPLEEKVLVPVYEKMGMQQKLYFEEPTFPAKLSPMVLADLKEIMEEEHRKIKAQLLHFGLKKEDLFSIEVLEEVQKAARQKNRYFFPKTTLGGSIAVASEKGVLINDIKTKKSFVDALTSLLLIHTIDSPFEKKALFFGGNVLQLQSIEAEIILTLVEEIIPFAKKAPISWYFGEASDKYQVYDSITPNLKPQETEKMEQLVERLEMLLKEIYGRI